MRYAYAPQQQSPYFHCDRRTQVYDFWQSDAVSDNLLRRGVAINMENTRHEFEVVRIWEQPASLFLQYPGLIPFAALGQSADAEKTLRQAAQQIDQIADSETASQSDRSVRDFSWVKIGR